MDWKTTPKGRYAAQRDNAKRRNIAFTLTFDEWWDVWQRSGMWDIRGRGVGKACMSRLNDKGPYALQNVKIQLQTDNQREALGLRWDCFKRVNRSYLPATEQAWYVPGWQWDREFNLIKA